MNISSKIRKKAESCFKDYFLFIYFSQLYLLLQILLLYENEYRNIFYILFLKICFKLYIVFIAFLDQECSMLYIKLKRERFHKPFLLLSPLPRPLSPILSPFLSLLNSRYYPFWPLLFRKRVLYTTGLILKAIQTIAIPLCSRVGSFSLEVHQSSDA